MKWLASLVLASGAIAGEIDHLDTLARKHLTRQTIEYHNHESIVTNNYLFSQFMYDRNQARFGISSESTALEDNLSLNLYMQEIRGLSALLLAYNTNEPNRTRLLDGTQRIVVGEIAVTYLAHAANLTKTQEENKLLLKESETLKRALNNTHFYTRDIDRTYAKDALEELFRVRKLIYRRIKEQQS